MNARLNALALARGGGSSLRLRLARAGIIAAALVTAAARPGAALRPTATYTSTPEQAEMPYEDVTFPTSDGVVLHGWLFPFQDQEGRTFREPGPFVILPTDGSDNMGSVLWHYYNFLRGTPWHVLAFDWRGFGTSGAAEIDTTTVVMPEFVLDLGAAIDYVKERPEFDGKHVGILAFGPGAAVALATAANRTDVSALVVRGIYTTQAEYCSQVANSAPESPCSPNPRWPAALEPINVASESKTPVLLVVGEKDVITPPRMMQAVHAALSGPKEVWVAPGAGHAGYDSPEFVHQRPFAVKLHEFFKLHMGTAGH